MKFKPKQSPLNKKLMEKRDKGIYRLWTKVGLTAPEIGNREGICRERVRQIIRKQAGRK